MASQQQTSFDSTSSTESIELFAPGSLLAQRYRIERELGRGGFGVVYLARDEQLHGKRVVIKVRHDETTTAEEWREKKFRQECEALARIDNPGVVGIFDQGLTPAGKLFLIMQYVEGETLRHALKSGPMQFARTADLVYQIAQALGAAHECGVCHRDLKPANIILRKLSDRRELPVIIDFGIAGIRDSDSTSSDSTKVAGSWEYMAPEQLAGKPEIASDIYSLGVIAYEMVTGKRPFPTHSHFDLLFREIEGVKIKPADLRKDLPLPAQDVILKALSYAPNDRYSRALDFGEDLRKGLSGQGPAQLHPRIRLLLLIVLTIGLLSAAAFLIRTELPIPRAGVLKQLTPTRMLSYQLVVQKYHNKKLSQPLQLVPGMPVESGDRLQFLMSSPDSGHLYLLNEGSELENGLPTFNTLFPSSSWNGGSSFVTAGQIIHFPPTISLRFDSEKGTEKLWLIWSTRELPQFEALKLWTQQGRDGSVQDVQQRIMLRNFLGNSSVAGVEHDDAHRKTRLSQNADPLVFPIRLEHR